MNNKIFEWAGVITAILYSLFVAMNIGIEFFGFCLLLISAILIGIWAQIPIKIADISNKQKPKNSIPIFIATNNEYKIAVITPAHSKILLFILFIHSLA